MPAEAAEPGLPDDGFPGLVDVVLEDERWHDLEALATRACGATLRHLELDPESFEVVVLGTDDARVAALNGEFRGRAGPTNVLSWPSEARGAAEPGAVPAAPHRPELGDIALAWETCVREAGERGRSLQDHVTHLLVHGTLHLLGYDHEDEADAELMEATEVAVLAGMGLSNPYGG